MISKENVKRDFDFLNAWLLYANLSENEKMLRHKITDRFFDYFEGKIDSDELNNSFLTINIILKNNPNFNELFQYFSGLASEAE